MKLNIHLHLISWWRMCGDICS